MIASYECSQSYENLMKRAVVLSVWSVSVTKNVNTVVAMERSLPIHTYVCEIKQFFLIVMAVVNEETLSQKQKFQKHFLL